MKNDKKFIGKEEKENEKRSIPFYFIISSFYYSTPYNQKQNSTQITSNFTNTNSQSKTIFSLKFHNITNNLKINKNLHFIQNTQNPNQKSNQFQNNTP